MKKAKNNQIIDSNNYNKIDNNNNCIEFRIFIFILKSFKEAIDYPTFNAQNTII